MALTMNTQQAYDLWSEIYDTNINKTRDLEGLALRQVLSALWFTDCLEIGCGTGKNTEWLVTKADHVTSVDLSDAMLGKAREKIKSDKVDFRQADVTQDWDFTPGKFDLIAFSLMLEHIVDLNNVFRKASDKLLPGGFVYVGELHPFKQYSGSKARFDTGSGQQIVPCFTHHVSEFVSAAKNNGLALLDLNEHFDDPDHSAIPRILTLLLRKS